MSHQTNLGGVETPQGRSAELRALALVVKERILSVSESWASGDPRKRSVKAERVASVLKALPDIDRKVITLFYFDGLTPREIGEALDLSVDQVRKIKTSAKRQIRQAIDMGDAAPKRLGEQYGPVIAHAAAVFGDKRKASHWLDTPLHLLGGRSPAQVLAEDGDVAAVEQILTRIEHNIPS